MKIKSYYSRTVEDAIASARAELGPDAMLVNSRKAPIQARHLGEYEVVFASLAPEEESNESDTALPAGPSAFAPPPSNDRLSNEVADLKKELEGMRRVLTRTAYAPQQWAGGSQDSAEAFAVLTAADVSPELAREIVQAACSRLAPQRGPLLRSAPRSDAAALQHALSEELSNRFTVEPQLGRNPSSARLVALVGPPGSGKTTTLVKLAVNYGLAARRPILLLSMDTYRVAAADQLRSYAAILGVGFQVLETVAALAQTIEENRGKELIFIDTPGLSFGEIDDAAPLAHFLSTREDIDTHLVLPASMKPGDLTRVGRLFECMRPNRLLFTKLDETASYGPILELAARTRKPLSFFAAGQRIPEDLEAASAPRLLELVLEGGGRVRAA
ncbi:MAG: flagellar biosynthesis protein FlhF [Acidobacteria bacterium]|nr:flagellar biosynthesis protein FlhF [Acidobacteriota bacterium]